MVEFWHDHFSVWQSNGFVAQLTHTHYDRDVIRGHVCSGALTDLLLETARSASMLYYLDGRSNVAEAPNENYAREVMELHTLGVDGPYTEDDIKELARCLTGWSYRPVGDPEAPGRFQFNAADHDVDPKTVLALQIPRGGGMEEGIDALHMLAHHAKTIDFVSRKLVRRFVSENAPEACVELVKATWTQTMGDLPGGDAHRFLR